MLLQCPELLELLYILLYEFVYTLAREAGLPWRKACLALQKLQGSASSGGDVAHLVCKTSLLNGCHAVASADDGDGIIKPCIPVKSR